MKRSYLYLFKTGVSMEDVEDSLALATLAAESIFGPTLLRLETSSSLDKRGRTCAIEASTPAGRVLACLFTGFVTVDLGERAFTVLTEPLARKA